MKKQRIVIASVLKPVDDTRMYEKIGTTLDASGKYDVFILGYPTANAPPTNIQLLPHRPFGRISFQRLSTPIKIFKKTWRLKPDVFITGTHELLIAGAVLRMLRGTTVVYDIRENYFRNILHSNSFPMGLRVILAAWVRLKEWLTAPLVSLFLLAEKVYAAEMHFFATRFLIVENKAIIPKDFRRTTTPGRIRLLFSGTLAESTGVFEAIRLAKALNKIQPKVELHIVGYAARAVTLDKIRLSIEGQSFITLSGGDRLVPHAVIQESIASSDFGIIWYPPSKFTEGSTPTKLFEYLACSLPILLQPRPEWLALCNPCQACIPVDVNSIDPTAVLNAMALQAFYGAPATDVAWGPEGRKLLEVLEGIKKL